MVIEYLILEVKMYGKPYISLQLWHLGIRRETSIKRLLLWKQENVLAKKVMRLLGNSISFGMSLQRSLRKRLFTM